MKPPFIQGLDLSRLFFEEAVGPLLAQHYPGLVHSAALLGAGSDVLGFDTPQSTDHDWGPRLMLFLSDSDHPLYRDEIDRLLKARLPREIHGYPTDMAFLHASRRVLGSGEDGIHHSVSILTVRDFFWHVLKIDPFIEPGIEEWLTFTEQHLRSIVSGSVFHDGLGQLEPIRNRLRYYPRDLWLYMLSAQWMRISQEEPFMGRCGQVGDDLGSRLVAARLVRDLIRLCFLMERQYAPYIKWFGSAFSQLKCASRMEPHLKRVLEADSWINRQAHLSMAYEIAAEMHNELGITSPLPGKVSQFFDRPFMVIQAGRFSDAIRSLITDPKVLALPLNLGSVDQFIDSTDALNFPDQFRKIYHE